MINVPKLLCDSSITVFDKVHDYTQIQFKNGAVFSIFNRFNVVPPDGGVDLIGSFFVSVSISPESITIVCSSGTTIRIGLRDEDFIGPEAATLALPSGQQIVW